MRAAAKLAAPGHRQLMGPHTADQIRPGDPYELSDGFKIECIGTGRRGSRSNGAGFMVLDSDPAAPPAGVDAGVAPIPSMLRAPDVAVGGLDNEPGWAPAGPPLCVEYADRGQDEKDLQKKILELFRFGTRFVWVVRMSGPRRIEVYEPGKGSRTVLPGHQLEAPGILKNPVPVEALYDREAAHEQTLKNLLQRRGYESLDAVRAEASAQGKLEGRRDALLAVLGARGLSVSEEERARILAAEDADDLDRWIKRAATADSTKAALKPRRR